MINDRTGRLESGRLSYKSDVFEEANHQSRFEHASELTTTDHNQTSFETKNINHRSQITSTDRATSEHAGVRKHSKKKQTATVSDLAPVEQKTSG